MNGNWTDTISDLANYSFPSEWVKALWIVAIIGSWMVMAMCAFLSRSTKRPPFGFWAGGWAFYSVYLATSIAPEESPYAKLFAMIGLGSVGVSAYLMLRGCLASGQTKRNPREVIFAIALIGVWSYVAAYVFPNQFWSPAPVFIMLAATSVYAGVQCWREPGRSRVTTILALCYLLWGLQLLAFPFVSFLSVIKVASYLISAVLTMAIGIGLVIREEAALSEQKYRGVLDSANAAIFLVDLWTLKILDANKAAQRLTKRSGEELLRCRILELCPDLRKEGDNRVDHRVMISAVFKPLNEFNFVRTDGSLVLCEGDTNLVQWHKRPVLQINVREVDKNKEIGQLVRRAEKMSSLGQLIAGVAHEINNPLAVVVGYAQIMAKQKIGDEKVRSNLEKILHESERAAKIVRDLLTFARPCQPQMVVTDINKLVDDLLDIREAELRAAHIQLEKRLMANLPRTKADPIQIEQVLTNLITNAIHALTSQNSTRNLTVATEEAGFFIRITVADNGPGIAPEIVTRIFDPFFTTKPSGKGTGLGLSISNSIMQEHRGKIWVQSDTGKGARFFVELPLVACEPETASDAPQPLADEESAAPANAEQRLLIVDDEPGIRDVLQEVLTASGYKVETASTGVEAMSRVSSCRFDLIISDLCMPEMDGEKFYETVRDIDPRLASRIIFVTGDTVTPQSRAFLEANGRRWLSKPFNIGDVERMVGSVLQPDPYSILGETNQKGNETKKRYHPSAS